MKPFKEIHKMAVAIAFGYSDAEISEAIFNIKTLSDEERVLVEVVVSNIHGGVLSVKGAAKRTSIEELKVKQILRSLKGQGIIEVKTAFNQDDGLICGSGFVYLNCKF